MGNKILQWKHLHCSNQFTLHLLYKPFSLEHSSLHVHIIFSITYFKRKHTTQSNGELNFHLSYFWSCSHAKLNQNFWVEKPKVGSSKHWNSLSAKKDVKCNFKVAMSVFVWLIIQFKTRSAALVLTPVFKYFFHLMLYSSALPVIWPLLASYFLPIYFFK